jgi:predicted Zn-dependent protease
MALLTALSCRGAVEPFTSPSQLSALPDGEQRVWGESDDLERILARSGQLLDDPVADAYLRDLARRLFPDLAAALRLRILKDPEMNAFCLPNGGVYLNVGMIARTRSESELATIVAHEGSHFTHRHGFQQRSAQVSTATFVQGAGLLGGLAAAAAGQLVGLSSIQGFSRAHEREADAAGFQRLVGAGLDPRDGPRVFERLAAEAQATGIREPYFFASHPSLRERIDSFTALARQATAPATSPDDTNYRAFAVPLQRLWLEQEIGLGRGERVIHVLTQPGAMALFPPESPFYLGEAYRLRGAPDDRDRMVEAYRTAETAAPRFAPARAALGVHYYRQKDCPRARPHLSAYLELEPSGPLSAHVRRFLEKCR